MRIGLTDLPKSAGASSPPCPSGNDGPVTIVALTWRLVCLWCYEVWHVFLFFSHQKFMKVCRSSWQKLTEHLPKWIDFQSTCYIGIIGSKQLWNCIWDLIQQILFHKNSSANVTFKVRPLDFLWANQIASCSRNGISFRNVLVGVCERLQVHFSFFV